MKISALEYFIETAESKSINEAAKKLFIAQSSLTKSLKLMEKELGVTLFDRSTTGIELTEAGRKILPEAKQVVEYYHGWCGMSGSETPSKISIYMHSSFSDLLVPDLLMGFRKKYPGIEIEYISRLDPESMISPSTNNPVICLCMIRDNTDPGIYSRQLSTPPVLLMKGCYTCLVNRDSPLAGRSRVTLDDLKDMFSVIPVSIHDAAKADDDDDFYDYFGNNPVNVDTLVNVINMVSKDPGSYAISFFPALCRYKAVSEGRLVSVPIASNAAGARLYMYYSAAACRRFPAMQALVKHIRYGFSDFISKLPSVD